MLPEPSFMAKPAVAVLVAVAQPPMMPVALLASVVLMAPPLTANCALEPAARVIVPAIVSAPAPVAVVKVLRPAPRVSGRLTTCALGERLVIPAKTAVLPTTVVRGLSRIALPASVKDPAPALKMIGPKLVLEVKSFDVVV